MIPDILRNVLGKKMKFIYTSKIIQIYLTIRVSVEPERWLSRQKFLTYKPHNPRSKPRTLLNMKWGNRLHMHIHTHTHIHSNKRLKEYIFIAHFLPQLPIPHSFKETNITYPITRYNLKNKSTMHFYECQS